MKCRGCGGPGSAGYGLLPSEVEIRKKYPGDARSYRELVEDLYSKLDLCYWCQCKKNVAETGFPWSSWPIQEA